MNISVEVQKKKDKNLKETSSGAIQTALLECGVRAQEIATKLCPVQTGRLRSSITFGTVLNNYTGSHAGENGEEPVENGAGLSIPKDDEMILGTNVSYAYFVEMGSSGKEKTPFLEPAITGHMKDYEQIFKKNFDKLK